MPYLYSRPIKDIALPLCGRRGLSRVQVSENDALAGNTSLAD
ncbi:hypothetical protein [Bradyrhizobium sp. STM 3557]